VAELSHWVPRLISELETAPALTDVTSDLQDSGLQAYVEIDRNAAARLGVPVSAIADALYDAFGQRQISTIFTHANQYRVVLEVRPEFQLTPDDIARLHVTGSDGRPVPLGGLARIEQRPTALLINHTGQFPSATVSFNLAPGAALGEAVTIELPAAIELRLQGAAEAFRNSLASTLWLILAAVLVMYIVLGVLYESFIHPVTILSTLPSATVGALLALKPARSHPPSRPFALSPDPDDDACGIVCRHPDAPRPRLGRRTAPATGSGDGWRTLGKSSLDPVHDACGVPVF